MESAPEPAKVKRVNGGYAFVLDKEKFKDVAVGIQEAKLAVSIVKNDDGSVGFVLKDQDVQKTVSGTVKRRRGRKPKNLKEDDESRGIFGTPQGIAVARRRGEVLFVFFRDV